MTQNTRGAWVAATLMMLVVLSNCARDDMDRLLRGVAIVSYSDKPPLSGFVRTWIRVTVRTDRERTDDLYIPYLRDDMVLPAVGGTCDIYYHYDTVDGLVGTTREHLERVRVIDEIIHEGRHVRP